MSTQKFCSGPLTVKWIHYSPDWNYTMPYILYFVKHPREAIYLIYYISVIYYHRHCTYLRCGFVTTPTIFLTACASHTQRLKSTANVFPLRLQRGTCCLTGSRICHRLVTPMVPNIQTHCLQRSRWMDGCHWNDLRQLNQPQTLQTTHNIFPPIHPNLTHACYNIIGLLLMSVSLFCPSPTKGWWQRLGKSLRLKIWNLDLKKHTQDHRDNAYFQRVKNQYAPQRKPLFSSIGFKDSNTVSHKTCGSNYY